MGEDEADQQNDKGPSTIHVPGFGDFDSKYVYCYYCGLPLGAPSILANVRIGLGITLLNRPLHPDCVGHYRAQMQAKVTTSISLIIGVAALVIALISYFR